MAPKIDDRRDEHSANREPATTDRDAESRADGAALPGEGGPFSADQQHLTTQLQLPSRAQEDECRGEMGEPTADHAGDMVSFDRPTRDYEADLLEVLHAPSNADARALARRHYERYGTDPTWEAIRETARVRLSEDIRQVEEQLDVLRRQLRGDKDGLAGLAEEPQNEDFP
ncbi:unnamed protein product [Peniophora sp. CBMAI 1063]|nr:unnamed protein product [Peniophora sp. CBMAI 1063]